MGRLPLNGAPQFRFLPAEVSEMEATARAHTGSIFPGSDVIDALAAKFSASPDRAGKVTIFPKQVLTWFHNRRYAPRSKLKDNKAALGKTVHPASGLRQASSSRVLPSAHGSGSSVYTPSPLAFLTWKTIVYNISQESEELAFYCDASVEGIERKRHDSTECDCKFLVRYEHDKSEEIVRLAKLRRRLETNDGVQHFPAARAANSADCCVQQTQANVNLASNEDSDKADQKDEKQHKNTHDATLASNSAREASSAASAATCNKKATKYL
ncbi:hypothetical protein EJB05_44849, partial [Eragrostis curvula]